MKRLAVTLMALLLPASAIATEWGVLPIQRRLLEKRQDDLEQAIGMVKAIPAPVYVTVLSWKDLEPKQGAYDIEDRLAPFGYAMSQGMRGYYGISVINTVKRDMPDDLAGMDWNDPALLPRFSALLDKLATQLPADLPYLIIGNEVDVYFEENPGELDAYLAFYAQASAEARKRFPKARIGITVTFEGLKKGEERAGHVQKLVAASDAAFFTFYPIFDLVPTAPAETPALLDTLIAAAQGKEVYLQEVGYSSGEAIGSSEKIQAEFFSTIIPAIAARPQIKLASLFSLYDLDPKLCELLTSYYGMSGWLVSFFVPPEKFRGFLCTLGLHDAEGRAKPAWDAAVKAIRSAQAAAAPIGSAQ